MKHFTVAIDGPAGAGKSTIAKLVADHLNIIYVDTGAMYRAVALYCLENKVNYGSKKEVEKILDKISINIKHEKGRQRIILNSEDVSDKIRTQEVAWGASAVAAIEAVRIKMVELQRKIAENTSVVMDGRDIGTHVLPNADVKVFLTASVKERANRRYKELKQKGIESCFSQVEKEIEERDKNDSSRKISPLRKAEDAIQIDTTGISIQEVTNKIIELVSKYTKES